MKISLPLKLGIFVVLLFGALTATFLLWTPLKILYYAGNLRSDDPEKSIEAVENLMRLGAKGMAALSNELGGGEKEVKFLTAHWANVNKVVKKEKHLTYPLHLAAEKGYGEISRLLIAKGADIIARDSYGRLPIHWAAGNGHKSFVELLIAIRAQSKSPSSTKPLLSNQEWMKRNPEMAEMAHTYWVLGRSAKECIINDGSMINSQDVRGDTPIHLAARGGHVSVTGFLITKGADVNAPNSYSATPIFEAAESGKRKIVESLIRKGANIRAIAHDGIQPIHCSANREIINLFIEKGIDLNAEMKVGILLSAALGGREEIVAFLIEEGVDVNSKNNPYSTQPLLAAASNGHKDVVELLIANGANVNDKANGSELLRDGITSLHCAAMEKNTEMAEILIKNGADVNAKTSSGITALDWAKSKEMKKLLRAHGAKTWEESLYEEKKK